jgi:hypothetical protein
MSYENTVYFVRSKIVGISGVGVGDGNPTVKKVQTGERVCM